MPLLAGVLREEGWGVAIRDLSIEYYSDSPSRPQRAQLRAAVNTRDIEALDELYFRWEDYFRKRAVTNRLGREFALLSGFSFSDVAREPLAVAAEAVSAGTPYSPFLEQRLGELSDICADVVAITIASQAQLLASIDLLIHVRKIMPRAYIIVGGNIVTRLRDSRAFHVLQDYCDQLVIYQGEAAMRELCRAIDAIGPERAKRELPRVVDGSQFRTEWPLPTFDGIAFDSIVGDPALSYVSTRGCYFGKCSFCAIPAGWSPTGYAGSRDAASMVDDLRQLHARTGIGRMKLVDEAFPPSKILSLPLHGGLLMPEWEIYARLEATWERREVLDRGYRHGLRKIYFGLEQAPSATRSYFGKRDTADPHKILMACADVGIAVHLFCMVGHPRTTRNDAWRTVEFLLANLDTIDTADLVGFRLDRGTSVPGVRPRPNIDADWHMSQMFEPTDGESLCFDEVAALEAECQEALWNAAPHLLHPLYRVIAPTSAVVVAGQMTGEAFQQVTEIVK
jgi:hypothetical protein